MMGRSGQAADGGSESDTGEGVGGWSHLQRDGRDSAPRSRMVDVGPKAPTRRTALASAQMRLPAGLLAELRAGAGPKGPVEEVARVAGILAAKRTGELIPMCHPLSIDLVDVTFHDAAEDVLEVRCRVACTGPTGVEMEALTGASVAALTIYDMAKSRDKGIRIERVELLEKTGGRSGDWRAGGE